MTEGNTINNVFGSCSDWSAIMSDVSQYTDRSLTLQMISSFESTDLPRTAEPEDVESYLQFRVTCSDPNVAKDVVTALSSPEAGDFDCGGSRWVVKLCPGVSRRQLPSLCVDCDDPCEKTSLCHDLDSSGQPTARHVISPCSPLSCVPTEDAYAPVSMSILSVTFAPLQPAPAILSMVTSSTKSAITIEATLGFPGSMYCAANKYDAASPYAPASSADIIRQNFVRSSDAQNVSSPVMEGLEAASSYIVHCTTVSVLGGELDFGMVLANARVVHTTCCKSLIVTQSTGSVTEQESVANFLVLSFSDVPEEAIQVDWTLRRINQVTGASVAMATSSAF